MLPTLKGAAAFACENCILEGYWGVTGAVAYEKAPCADIATAAPQMACMVKCGGGQQGGGKQEGEGLYSCFALQTVGDTGFWEK